jgi:competence protein ComEC
MVLCIFFCISRIFSKHITNSFYGFTFSLAMFLTGLLLYNEEVNSVSLLEQKEAVFTGILSDYPEEKENSVKMILKLDKRIVGGFRGPVSGSIVLYNKKDSCFRAFLPGDKLSVKCTPAAITSRGNPYEFDYGFYMQCQGIRYYAYIDGSDILAHNAPKCKKLIHRALIVRERIINMFRERGVEGEKLALVAAITLGQKNMLDPEQKQYFIKAGVMHIMAVSGLHAVILSLFIFKVLFFLKGRFNILRVLITLVILWLFAFVTGLTPSVLRATLMFSFLQAGNMLKRPVNAVNSVLASAFVLIMIRPSVIFDAGFLLSYAAVIYIVSFYRDLYLKIRFRSRIPDLIWQSVAVTVIAQAGTLPLTIMLFNRFPVWFILSNVIIVPISSLVIITGCLVPLFYTVPFLSEFISRILGHITGLTEFLTEKAASLPLATIDNIGLTSIECILLTITIFLFTMVILRKKSISVLFPLTALLLYVLAVTIKATMTRNTDELIVYNSIGSTTIGIRSGKTLNIYSEIFPAGAEVSRHRSVLNLKVRYNMIESEAFMVKAGKRNILITNSLNNTLLKVSSPDIVIIKGNPQIQKETLTYKEMKAVIVSNEALQRKRFYAAVRSLGADTVHFVRKDGAFFMRL